MNKQEIIKKIKNREVAIFNDDKESLRKCLKIVFPKDIFKAQGVDKYYYASDKTKLHWFNYHRKPEEIKEQIKATELIKILEGEEDCKLNQPLSKAIKDKDFMANYYNALNSDLPTLTETQQFKPIGRLAGRYLNKPLKQLNDYSEVQYLQRSGDYYHFLCDKKYVVVCVIVSE
jgi:hypothetical protein